MSIRLFALRNAQHKRLNRGERKKADVKRCVQAGPGDPPVREVPLKAQKHPN